MTKKPPKTLWVNVYKSRDLSDGFFLGSHLSKKYAKQTCINDGYYVGTFKYVLADKGKK